MVGLSLGGRNARKEGAAVQKKDADQATARRGISGDRGRWGCGARACRVGGSSDRRDVQRDRVTHDGSGGRPIGGAFEWKGARRRRIDRKRSYSGTHRDRRTL